MRKTKNTQRRIFYLLLDDWTWWAWLVTAFLLLTGILGYPVAFLGAMALTALQLLVVIFQERQFTSFAVQLRFFYLLILVINYIPPLRPLYWIPMLGTFALVTVGYCLLSRLLFLLPWNRNEPLTRERLRRTFLTPPDLSRVEEGDGSSCPGGLCTIKAQFG